MSDTSKVLATKFTDDRFPIVWKDEEEKSLMWYYDDLHCPNPISPLYFDIGGWWDCEGRWGSECSYMYQRFGAPIGKAWLAKNIGGYVYTAVVPPEISEDKVSPMFNYYSKVMPIYADTFMERWHKEYVPRLMEMQKKLLDFDFQHRSLPEIMIHMEDALDIKSEAFRIHWIINLAQFQASSNFTNVYAKVMGKMDEVEIGRINVSPADRNWDSLKTLWTMKEYVCSVPPLIKLFKENSLDDIYKKVQDVEGGSKLMEMVNNYREEYGFKAMYTHEFIYKTWFEDPRPVYEAVHHYVMTNYDFNAEYNACMETQKAAIDGLYARISDPDMLAELKYALELCVKMAPLTPDHHFYIDQGIYSHLRVMFVEIGKKMTSHDLIDDPEDIFMLKYDEIRCTCTSDYPVKDLVRQRRAEIEEAKKRAPQEWYGTATEWQLYNEPYKSLWGYPQKFEAEMEEARQAEISKTVLKGIPGCSGVYEGVARLVSDPSELDNVQSGDILICKMTNPAWVVAFSKIGALVTDTGGSLSHPAVVAREFNVPCVVGTRRATQVIKNGDRVRVDGTKGIAEVIS